MKKIIIILLSFILFSCDNDVEVSDKNTLVVSFKFCTSDKCSYNLKSSSGGHINIKSSQLSFNVGDTVLIVKKK